MSALHAVNPERIGQIAVPVQDLDRAVGFSDRLICMLEGRVGLEGRASELSRTAITDAYFGLTASLGEHDA
jgi:branched-chain amino acid transport system ATP-binding protein